jgi:Fur family zinc uptake transcriptional regulator
MMAKAKTDGGFLQRTQVLLARADELCARRGVRLTDLRRQVLGTILDAGSPVGAYDILDRLRVLRPGATPPSVYRTLEFLLSQGFVHRLERLSAFVGCLAKEGEEHSAQFLICRNCGKVLELEDDAVNEALMRAARQAGFAMLHATVEAEGICQACAAVKPAADV